MSFTTLQTPKTSTLSTTKVQASTTTATTIRFAETQSTLKKCNIQPIWSWTFKAEATAECSIKDALEMTENKIENFDFFWIGRVPCRTIQMVGIVVGVQVYEKKVVYTVDDGTGVIDCEHIVKHATFEPAVNISKYVMPAPAISEPPRMPEPVAILGDFVKVVGRVRPSFETRKIITQSVEKCYATDEMTHIRKVRRLHATHYDIDEEWVLPPPHTPVPATPKRVKLSTPAPTSIQIPAPHPSTGKSTIASSVSSSPVLPVIRESVPQTQVPQTPRKLRHPSRLHTQDLTDATFRIYLKHYMDHAPILPPPAADEDCDFECPPSSQPDPWATPRPTQLKLKAKPTSSQAASTSTEPPLEGFTLSYLRRVPELALLAARVVQAHARRKAREERKKLKESGNLTSQSRSSATSTSKDLPPEKAAPKIKRLFQWAIKQLYMDGSIVLWDGPVRRIPSNTAGGGGVQDLSALWKANTSTTSTMGSSYPASSHADNTIFSSTTNTSIINTTLATLTSSPSQGYISDPPTSTEESYISLTPSFLSPHIMQALHDLTERNLSIGKPYAGVSAEGVVGLMKRDDRWRYLGVWSVEEVLGVLEGEGRVWRMGNGRWDVTICE